MIKLNVIPEADLKLDDEVITGFTMQFTYNNSSHTSTPEKDSQVHNALNVRVYVNAGKIAA